LAFLFPSFLVNGGLYQRSNNYENAVRGCLQIH
jgi:hypothetical protein